MPASAGDGSMCFVALPEPETGTRLRVLIPPGMPPLREDDSRRGRDSGGSQMNQPIVQGVGFLGLLLWSWGSATQAQGLNPYGINANNTPTRGVASAVAPPPSTPRPATSPGGT